MDLRFITANPATESYQRGRLISQQELAQQQHQDQIQRQDTIQTATLPTQLRQMTAGADLAQTNAGVAAATAPARISEANSAATTAGVNAQYAAPEAKARLGQMNASIQNSHAQMQMRELELIEAGRGQEAQMLAAQRGEKIPDQIIQNGQLRSNYKTVLADVLRRHPDNPAAADQELQLKLREMQQQPPQGQPATPLAVHAPPEGAPAPTAASGVHNYDVVNRQEQDENGKPVVRSYRFDKRTGNMTPIEGDGVVLPRNAAGSAGGAGGGLTPEAINGAAERVLNGDPKALQNIGRGAQGAAALTAINNRTYELAKERGISAQQIGTQVAAFAGQQAAMRTLGTKGANIEYAANTASRAIDFAQEAMAKVSRSQFLPLGRLQQAIDTQTNSAEQAAAFTAVNTLVNEYARVVSPTGQPTEGTRQHAREMLNTAQSHEAFNATLAMMRREIASAKAAFDQTRQEFLARGSDAVGGPSPTPALTGAPGASSSNGSWTDPATGKTYQIINGQLHE